MEDEWDEGAWNSAVIAYSGRYGEERARGGASTGGWEWDWATGDGLCDEYGMSRSEAQAEARSRVSSNWGSISSEARGL